MSAPKPSRCLHVLAPGPLSTVQDLGRPGYQRLGVSVSGAADPYALRLGNLLAGNEENAAGVEVALGNAEFEFSAPAVFAVTGADLGAALNGGPVPMWEAVGAAAGDRLSFAGGGTGLRAYVCVAGGIDTPPALGSRATHLAAKLGGVDGRALRAGDELPLGPPDSAPAPGRRVPGGLIPGYGGEVMVRVVPGPQDDRFPRESLETFFESEFTVSDRTDRMGVRLDGPEVPAIDGAHDIVSDAVVTGAIQVPGDGHPIVLLSDRQTTGGYVKLGVVASVDLPLLAQSPPGARVRFRRITVEQAQAAAREREAALSAIVFDEPAAEMRQYELVVCGANYHVQVPAARGGEATVRVDGVEYRVEVAEE